MTKEEEAQKITVESLCGYKEGTVLPSGETIKGISDDNGNVIGWYKAPAGAN